MKLKVGDVIRRVNSKGKENRYKVKKILGNIVVLYDPENNVEFETPLEGIIKSNYEIEDKGQSSNEINENELEEIEKIVRESNNAELKQFFYSKTKKGGI